MQQPIRKRNRYNWDQEKDAEDSTRLVLTGNDFMNLTHSAYHASVARKEPQKRARKTSKPVHSESVHHESDLSSEVNDAEDMDNGELDDVSGFFVD